MKQETNQGITKLISGTVMLLFIGLIYAWSIFRAPLGAMFPDWSLTQLSMTFTISMAFFCIGGFVSGKLTLKIPHRIVMRISAMLILVGFVLITFVLNPEFPTRSLVLMYILYGVLGGGGVGLSYNSTIACVNRWFPGRTGLASGVLLLGFGVGGLVLGGLVNYLTGIIGVTPVFAILGVLLAVILFTLSFIMKAPDPEQQKLIEAASPIAKNPTAGAVATKDYTLTEMVKTPTFWVLFCWVIASSTSGLLVINSAATIALSFGAPAVIGLIVSVFNGIGRPATGALHDQIGRFKTMVINSGLLILSGVILVLAAVTGQVIFLYIGLPLVGLAFGGSPSLLAGSTMGFFGPKNFSINLGTLTFGLLPAAIIGPLISSKLQEASGGDYLTTFIMLIIVGTATLAVVLILNAISKKL